MTTVTHASWSRLWEDEHHEGMNVICVLCLVVIVVVVV